MLDIAKLAEKIPGISQHFQQEMTASCQRLELAKTILKEAKNLSLIHI